MDHENEDHDHVGDAAHFSNPHSTLSGAYAVAVPVQSPGSESIISSPDCLVSAGADSCSGHGVCQLNPGSQQHFCECSEGWFGPHCQCGEQPNECSESNHCHWCGPLSLCLMSKEECEAGESALHGQVHRRPAAGFTRCKTRNAPSGAPQSGHAAAPVSSRAMPLIAGVWPLSTFNARVSVEEAMEKVPEHQGLPQVDAEISAMEHQEKAYEMQVTFTCSMRVNIEFSFALFGL